jgi:Siphovirus Gp157
MSAAPVIPINIHQPLVAIQDHLEALFDTYDMTEEGSPEREALTYEIAVYLEAEIRKVDSIAGYLAHCEAQQEFAAQEIKRLQERKSSWARKQERLEDYIIRVMELAGKPKLEGRTSTLSVRPCPPSVEVVDQSLVPPEYIRTVVTESVDKTAAKAALKAGENIAGLKLVTDKRSVVRK